jgi:hypothetical protein
MMLSTVESDPAFILLGGIALWLRMEHRLTQVEDKIKVLEEKKIRPLEEKILTSKHDAEASD